MRDYEVTIIVQPELEEQARNELLERVQGWLAPEAATAEAEHVLEALAPAHVSA